MTDFNVQDFAKECYEAYSNYMNKYGTERDTKELNDFCAVIFPNKEEMKEILSQNEEMKELYKENYEEIRETFPFEDYKIIADRLNAELTYEDGGNILFEKQSPNFQNFNLYINDVEPTMSNFEDKFNEALDNFDPSYEAYLCLDNTGHGRNGDEMGVVYQDMVDCQEMSKDFLTDLSNIVYNHQNLPLSERLIKSEFLHNVKEQYGYLKDNSAYSDETKSIMAFKNAFELVNVYEHGNLENIEKTLNNYMQNDLGINSSKDYEKGYQKVVNLLQAKEQSKSKNKEREEGYSR